jgi:hypothetical protein
VWWSALQNPEDWTPSIATQCGYVRLLDTPGPITQLVAFKDAFFAFKENSIYIGTYIGPPYIFQWRLVSSKIGCVAATNHGVVEADDRLYFPHTTGFYEFDGASLRNVGVPVWKSIINSLGYSAPPASTLNPGSLSNFRLAVDDIEGVVWVMGCMQDKATSTYIQNVWGYNVRAGKWCMFGGEPLYSLAPYAVNPPIFIEASHSDMHTFMGSDMNPTGRVWRISNHATYPEVSELSYPAAWTNTSTVTTAITGSQERSVTSTGLCYRTVFGSSADPFYGGVVSGYADETTLNGASTSTGALNSELARFDCTLSSRYRRGSLTGQVGKVCLLAGVGIELAPPATR